MAFRVKTFRLPVMATFHVDAISYVRVTKDSRGNGFKCVPITADRVQDASYSSNSERDLQDRYFEVTLNSEADEHIANEMFQAFGALISVKFKNGVFNRRGL